MPLVLHFKTHYLNPTETFVDRLVRNHERFRARVVTQRKGHYTEGIAIDEAPQTGLWGAVNRGVTLLDLTPPHLMRMLLRHRPQVVNGHIGRDAFRALPGCALLGIPLVANFYGHDASRLPTRPAWRRRFRLLARAASHVVCVSEDLREQLLNLGFSEQRTSVVHVGVDRTHLPLTRRTRAGGRVLAMGRLVEKKGFEFAVEAFAQLKARGLECRLDIYGEGEARAQIEQAIERFRVGDRVRLLGPRDHQRLMQALSDYDLFVGPSVVAVDGDREGIPNTILEAMASGLPVVATQHGGIPELVTHERTGLLVPERDATALAAALERLMTDDALCEKFSAAGHKRAAEQFSVRSWVRGMEAVYDRVLAER